ncbi:hypothetical protein QAD02_003705 [Eretmocerus hayati]|uniref:Uncharacterized protein n=1 Tax=Eretmocerus hayati TaxID=131215 RepID=A0ACC2NPA1_9HYME|nr:hypothetical protein QAD02_003705 [Eretmocerus hayati]
MMDVETVKVIQLLFPDGIPDMWRDNPDFYKYLVKAGGSEVDQLKKEPGHLVEERNSMQHNIQSLVFSNHKIFIQIAENSRVIFNEFDQTQNKLDNLLDKIPGFVSNCKSFCGKSSEIQVYQKRNAHTISKSGELADLLELPHLMESCLESSHYHEALELSQYAQLLCAKHGGISLIEIIKDIIDNSWSVMIDRIIQSLRENLPLPRCLQLISLLRSINAFSESELRLKFIQARNSWFQELLESISTEDATGHLTRVIDLSRIHLFNIITQYKALFNDDVSTLERDIHLSDSAVFHQWLEHKVSQFLSVLERDLLLVTSMDSILGQCTYFGLSLGRVGVDFTGRMSNIFLKTIRSKFKKSILEVTMKCEKDLQSSLLVSQSLETGVKIQQIINLENPPERLVECYPLAEYCNGIISIFNDLRSNAPLALAQCLTSSLQNSLFIIANAIASIHQERYENSATQNGNDLVAVTECLCEFLIPHIQLCICALYPPQLMATYLGVPVGQLQKDEIVYLNQNYITKPVEVLMIRKNVALDEYLNKLLTSGDSSRVEDHLLSFQVLPEKTNEEHEKDAQLTVVHQ